MDKGITWGTETPPINLFKKILEIRKAVPYLQKENNNKAQGFNYVSSSQVLGAVRKKSDELGVLYIPAVLDSNIVGEYRSEKMTMTKLSMEYLVVDVESGETMRIPWNAPQGTDQHEKGVGKALTYGEKYFLLKFYNIPTDKDDPDAWADDINKSFDKSRQVTETLKPMVMPDALKLLIADGSNAAASGQERETTDKLKAIADYVKANEHTLAKGILVQARKDYKRIQDALQTVLTNKAKAEAASDRMPY